MNDLEKYFNENQKRSIHKWNHYFEIYDRHFSRFRNKEIVVLEIGTQHGGSLQMWKHYFGDRAKIYGVDIDPRTKFEEENIEVIIGSQSDVGFLTDLKKRLPKFDILIDDGGHTMKQQKITFEHLYEHIKDDGIYLCEDLHSSYRSDFGGGYKRPDSFIEYTKNFIDSLNYYHHKQGDSDSHAFANTTKSIHYYDSVIVLEKGIVTPPGSRRTGNKQF